MREGRGWRGGIKDESGRDGSAAMVAVRRDDGGGAEGESTAAAGEEGPRVAHQRVYWLGRRSLGEAAARVLGRQAAGRGRSEGLGGRRVKWGREGRDMSLETPLPGSSSGAVPPQGSCYTGRLLRRLPQCQ